MNKTPVIAIFDIGKTNKKLFLFDEQYQMVYEENIQLPETKDEDGFACEDLASLTGWIKESFGKIKREERFDIIAVNFSAYGASFVHLNEKGKPCTPLYNYLKPYPDTLLQQFYKTYGGESAVARQTASPVLGSLNSGMQLYRLKQEQPELYEQIRYSLHLPQYLSFTFSGIACTDITSIGCHTNLWNFQQQGYHQWVYQENIIDKLAPLVACTTVVENKDMQLKIGSGLHDSSAALIPYLAAFHGPFILLSTGTWCISINPFNHTTLTDGELHNDCLCYLTYEGTPVKASRLFAGYEHEQQTKKLSAHFDKGDDYYKTVSPDTGLLHTCMASLQKNDGAAIMQLSAFNEKNLTNFNTYEEAYHILITDLVSQQITSMNLVLKGTPVKRIFVDGGFSNNSIYMHLLASAFPHMEVYAASVAQASAMGAALAIHPHWNTKPLPSDIITLKYYSVAKPMNV